MTLHNMKLGEWLKFSSVEVLRVPGGWLFCPIEASVCFVPYSTEFKIEKPDPTPRPSNG